MEPTQDIVNGLFSQVGTTILSGIIPDFKAAIFALLGIAVVLMAFEVIVGIITGETVTGRVSSWWEEKEENDGYSKYKEQRNKKADYAARYEAEKIGKNDAEAGMAYLQKQRKNRP